MGRPSKDDDGLTRLVAYVPPETLAAVDKIRGIMPRSVFVTALLVPAVEAAHVAWKRGKERKRAR